MRTIVVLAVAVLVAIILIATKPTPDEVVQAALGRINYTVINKGSMPQEFLPAVAAAAVIEGIAQLLREPGRAETSGSLKWQSSDLVFFRYSNLAVANLGSLKCLWLLRSGFCYYFKA